MDHGVGAVPRTRPEITINAIALAAKRPRPQGRTGRCLGRAHASAIASELMQMFLGIGPTIAIEQRRSHETTHAFLNCLIGPLRRKIQMRGSAASIQARSEPSPVSPVFVTKITCPRPPLAAAPKP
jgi:hypothetical protein